MAMVNGFFEIDVKKVRVRGIDPDFQVNHHGYTRQEIERWMKNLKEIQRLCREKGYTDEDFKRMRNSPDQREREIAESYEHFYGGEGARTITVRWERDHYEVEEGHHRLIVAQQMGIRHIPARVYAPDEGTLQRLREEGERISAGEQPVRERKPLWERTAQERKRLEPER